MPGVVDVSVALPHAPTAPRAARALVAEHLGGEQRCDEVALCISEIVTNAVRHAASAPLVRFCLRGRTVRVETADASPDAPVVRPHDPTATGGRGLRIVDALADRWGTERTGSGKVVWFEIDLDNPPTRARA